MRVALCLLASALLHGLVLSRTARIPQPPAAPGEGLHVSLISAKESPVDSARASVARSEPGTKTPRAPNKSSRAPASPPRTQAAKSGAAPPGNDDAASTPRVPSAALHSAARDAQETLQQQTQRNSLSPDPPAKTQAAAQSQRVSRLLRRRFMAHFRYPELARRRGWQGDVRVGLRVEADGRLSHLRVLRSSGYSALDRAAVRALRDIGAIPEAAIWLHGRALDLQLPVEYRIVDS